MNTKTPVRMANTGVTETRWTRDDLSLLVKLDARGVCSIARDDRFVPGQMVLWSEFADRHPALDTIKPWGKRLAHELDQALAGCLVEVHVPWVPPAPAWHVELYRHIFGLPPGKTTDMPENMTIHDKLRDRREIARALRQCPLVPLVPLHRVKAIDGHPIPFPWGAGWRRYLLEQERRAGAGSEAQGAKIGQGKFTEGIHDG